jgi:hypothetical protein
MVPVTEPLASDGHLILDIRSQRDGLRHAMASQTDEGALIAASRTAISSSRALLLKANLKTQLSVAVNLGLSRLVA